MNNSVQCSVVLFFSCTKDQNIVTDVKHIWGIIQHLADGVLKDFCCTASVEVETLLVEQDSMRGKCGQLSGGLIKLLLMVAIFQTEAGENCCSIQNLNDFVYSWAKVPFSLNGCVDNAHVDAYYNLIRTMRLGDNNYMDTHGVGTNAGSMMSLERRRASSASTNARNAKGMCLRGWVTGGTVLSTKRYI